MSHSGPCGRLTPRWSVDGGGHSSAASIAGLPGSRAWVRVGPPLSWSGPMIGSALRMSPPPKQVPSLLRLSPCELTGLLQFLAPFRPTRVLCTLKADPEARWIPPPAPDQLAWLEAMVTLSSVATPLDKIPPPWSAVLP